MSAAALSFSRRSESSRPPWTIRTEGNWACTCWAFSGERIRAEMENSGYFVARTERTSPPMYPVAPVLVRTVSRR
jgi:hypothetical protein